MNLSFNVSFQGLSVKPAAKKSAPKFEGSGDYLDKALSNRLEAQLQAWDAERLKKLKEQNATPQPTATPAPATKLSPSK